MQYEQVSDVPWRQAFYEVMRERGESHRMAETLACQQFPGLKTDTEFFKEGWKDQFNGTEYGAVARKIAAKAGVSTSGKRYMHGLARFPGDPEAWVDSKGEIRKRCEERGWGCDGEVKVKREDFDIGPTEKPYVAEDIVEDQTWVAMAANPDAGRTPKARERLKEEIREKLTPKTL